MTEYINKDDLKFLEIPIAPVLQGEQVHYEKGFLKEWLESVPTADVVERSEIDKAIEEMNLLAAHKIRPISFDQSVAIDMCINILKSNIGENNK